MNMRLKYSGRAFRCILSRPSRDCDKEVIVNKLAALTFASLLLGALAPAPAAQQGDIEQIRKQLIGSYKLISYDSYDQNGAVTRLPYVVGQISYDAAGRMSAQLMGENRPAFTPGRPASETDRAAAYSTYISYFGHYTIEPEKRTVTHHVEGALAPTMLSNDLVRYFEFSPDGKSLFLSVKNGERVAGKLRWDRY
jgi:hypothetical protein